MFDEPDEGRQEERPADPVVRAKEKAEELKMYAELHAVFEATRKFEAQVLPGLDADLARDVQRTMAKLERSKTPGNPILPPASVAEAARLLEIPESRGLSTNDYHVHRRPGEAMVVRWLAGEEVETFYERLQAHVDAALAGCREDEHEEHDWKKDPATTAYLEALDKVEVKMADAYLREPIRKHGLFVLSTQTADELNIVYLTDAVMGAPAAELVGEASAPVEGETDEKALAWFFKLFALRGTKGGVERMCFFAFLQKTDDDAAW